MRQNGVLRHYSDGATAAQRGTQLDSILVVVNGRLRSMTSTADGQEHLIRWVEAGEVTGVASVVANLPFQADLVASGECAVLAIPGKTLVEVISKDPAVGFAVSKFLAERLSEMFDHVAVQAQQRLGDRLAASLSHLAIQNGEKLPDGRVRLRLTQSDISRVVGVSRQSVNEELRQMQLAGQIEIGYGQILISPANLFRDPSKAMLEKLSTLHKAQKIEKKSP